MLWPFYNISQDISHDKNIIQQIDFVRFTLTKTSSNSLNYIQIYAPENSVFLKKIIEGYSIQLIKIIHPD